MLAFGKVYELPRIKRYSGREVVVIVGNEFLRLRTPHGHFGKRPPGKSRV
jgi:hypothetical protein